MKLYIKLIKYDTRIDVECNLVSILVTSSEWSFCLLFEEFMKDWGKE